MGDSTALGHQLGLSEVRGSPRPSRGNPLETQRWDRGIAAVDPRWSHLPRNCSNPFGPVIPVAMRAP